MGSMVGTIKEAVEGLNSSPRLIRRGAGGEVGVLKIKSFRPFPNEDIIKIIGKTKYVAVLDKSISLGHIGPLAGDVKSVAQGKVRAKIKSYIVGLGGRDITKDMISDIISDIAKKNNEEIKFIGK